VPVATGCLAVLALWPQGFALALLQTRPWPGKALGLLLGFGHPVRAAICGCPPGVLRAGHRRRVRDTSLAPGEASAMREAQRHGVGLLLHQRFALPPRRPGLSSPMVVRLGCWQSCPGRADRPARDTPAPARVPA
jgi:hypothetical protein